MLVLPHAGLKVLGAGCGESAGCFLALQLAMPLKASIKQVGISSLAVELSALKSQNLGACATTTTFLNNKISAFKILLSWRFSRKKQRFWTISFSAPKPPPLKSETFIFIVVSPSLRIVIASDFRVDLRRPITTLGFSPPLDAQEPLTRGIPQSMSS